MFAYNWSFSEYLKVNMPKRKCSVTFEHQKDFPFLKSKDSFGYDVESPVCNATFSESIALWSKTGECLSTSLHNFARKAILQVLSTVSNLVMWKRLSDPSCLFCACGKVQTNKWKGANMYCQTVGHLQHSIDFAFVKLVCQ